MQGEPHRKLARPGHLSRRALGRAIAVAIAVVVATGSLAGRGAASEDRFVVVNAGKIIPVSGDEIEDGTIVIRNGKIEAIGKKVEVPRGAKIVDARDMTVMPGLVHPYTRKGLPGYRRRGTLTHLTVAEELFPQGDEFEDLLEAGFTTVALYPDGDGLPGQATVIRPDGSTREELVVDEAAYVLIPFGRPSSAKRNLANALKQAQAEIDKIEKARKAWEEKQKKAAEEAKKKAEEEKKKGGDEKDEKKPEDEKPPKGGRAEGDDEKKPGGNGGDEGGKKEPEEFVPPEIREELKPLVDLIRKEDDARAVVEIAQAEGFVHFEDVREDHEIARHYLVRNANRARITPFGGINDTDVGQVAEAMGEAEVTVAFYPLINQVPYTTERVNLPAEFGRAGCKIVLFPAGDSDEALERFRGRVAEVVKYGLSREDALAAMTVNAAAMLGLDERKGTLEAEKDADLIFLDGDPLDPFSRVKKVMIGGEIVAEPVPNS